MQNKVLCAMLAAFLALGFAAPLSYAVGAREAGASLLLPTTGQAMNGQLGMTKSKVMAGVEVAAIVTVAILGTAVGGGIVWAGLGPLIANHLWSSKDAYNGAQEKHKAYFQQQLQMAQAQKTLDLSRQRRFEREQISRSDIRTRVAAAGEAAYVY